MPKTRQIQIESKNALLELLREGKTINKIYIAQNAFNDPKTKEILELARNAQVPISKETRKKLGHISRGKSYESVIGFMEMENQWTLKELLDKIYSQNLNPFFLLLDHIKYDQNLGAILRSAYAAGVNGIVTPVKRDDFLTGEAIRISMGAALRIPIVEMSIFEAIKDLKKNGVTVYAVTMDGEVYFKEDLRGGVAFILGAEDVGISTRALEKSDKKISIPMREGIGSLNVAASAAIISYEKLRQEVTA